MTLPNRPSRGTFPINDDAWQALRKAASAVAYNTADDTVYELHLTLRTPGIFALYKADNPAPGLPMLDGFLKYVAFRQVMATVITQKPYLTNELLWQWNLALRQANRWIDFPIPIRQEMLSPGITIYDCSVGLPVADGHILYPAGAFFVCDGNLVSYPSEKKGPADQIALRRRSVEPMYRLIDLTGKLDTQSGGTKALDHRIYYTLSREYVFYFRGDPQGVEQLLNFAIQEDIGIGKKTTLGYGRIDEFRIEETGCSATLGHSLNIAGMFRIALLKNIPYSELQRRCIKGSGVYAPAKIKDQQAQWKNILSPSEWSQNERLFGAQEFALASPLETFDCYFPPYWLKEKRTQVLRYGTLLVSR